MTIQPPPNDEIPLPTPIDPIPDATPIDTPQEPEQRAPGEEQPPLGAPRDEPDPEVVDPPSAARSAGRSLAPVRRVAVGGVEVGVRVGPGRR